MSWRVIARKEYAEHLRNYWILTVSLIFLVLTLVASGIVALLLSLGADLTLASVRDTIGTMRVIAVVLLPILALILGYGALAGERESGSLGLLAAQPVTRAQVLLGKYAGLAGVLSTAVAAGVGSGGLLVLMNTREGLLGAQVLIVFLLETLLWGAAWMSLALLISSIFVRRSTAAAGALLVWFLFSIIWVPLAVIIVASTGQPGVAPARAPQWLLLLELLNPNGAYGGLVSRTIGGYPGVIGSVVQAVLPLKATAWTFAVALVGWVVLPLVGAYALFRRRDV